MIILASFHFYYMWGFFGIISKPCTNTLKYFPYRFFQLFLNSQLAFLSLFSFEFCSVLFLFFRERMTQFPSSAWACPVRPVPPVPFTQQTVFFLMNVLSALVESQVPASVDLCLRFQFDSSHLCVLMPALCSSILVTVVSSACSCPQNCCASLRSFMAPCTFQDCLFYFCGECHWYFPRINFFW